MLGLVLVLIAWGPSNFDRPTGPRWDRSATPPVSASFSTSSTSPSPDRREEPGPPGESALEEADDEIEGGDDFEDFGFPFPHISAVHPTSATTRFHHPSVVAARPSPEARSPRLRC